MGVLDCSSVTPTDAVHHQDMETAMKRIEVTVRPAVFSVVQEALQAVGVHVMTISRCATIGHETGPVELYRGIEGRDSKATVKIEVVVADNLVARVRDAIVCATRNDDLSTGRILITPLETAIDLGNAVVEIHVAESSDRAA